MDVREVQFQQQKNLAIHKLAFGGVVHRTQYFLGIGASTFSKYTHMVSEVLVDNFYDKYIKIP